MCSLFFKGKASYFKAFNTCRKHTSGCLSWCFSSLTALQTTPCCYFPFLPYPKRSFSTLDTFQHNGKNILSCAVCSNFLWNALSLKKKSLCVPGSTKSHFPVVQRPLLGSETIHPGGKLMLSWEGSLQVASRRTQEPPQPEGNLQVWML